MYAIRSYYGRLFDKMLRVLESKGSKDKDYLRVRDQISTELMTIRFTARTVERLCDSVRGLVDNIRSHERQIHDISVNKAQMPRQHFIKVFVGTEGSKRWLTGEINAGHPWSEQLARVEPSILASMEARSAGYDESLMLDVDGYAAEGCGENLFIVRNGIIKTPPIASVPPNPVP